MDDTRARERSCRNCGAPFLPDQDWCLRCGAGAPGSLSGGLPGWRSAATIATTVTVLLAGSAVAAYAALNHQGSQPPAVAQTPAAPAPAPVAPTTPTAPPAAVPAPAITVPTVPETPTPPPKIPLATPTPAATPGEAVQAPSSSEAASPSEAVSGAEAVQSPSGTSKGDGAGKGSAEGQATQPEPLVLDTDAASTYNPEGYARAGIGDPGLAIDAEASTAWTALMQPGAQPGAEAPEVQGLPTTPATGETTATTPAETTTTTSATTTSATTTPVTTTPVTTAPGESEGAAGATHGIGLAIDLRKPQRLATLLLRSSTPGMTVAVYGANGPALPASISQAGWTRLVKPRKLKQRDTSLTLKTAAKRYRWVLVWVLEAPASPRDGQPAGGVAVNEVELFPPAS